MVCAPGRGRPWGLWGRCGSRSHVAWGRAPEWAWAWARAEGWRLAGPLRERCTASALSHMPGRRGFRVWGNSGTGPSGPPTCTSKWRNCPRWRLEDPSRSGSPDPAASAPASVWMFYPGLKLATLSGACVCSPPQPFWLSLSSQNQAGRPQLGNPRTTSFGSMAQGL